MKINPKQAPLYGECVLTVQLSEDECVDDEEDVEFYLLFSGSTQRHLTTTLRLGHVTLQAVCPAHDRDEMVQVTLCQARPGGSVDSVSEEHFQFVHDLALDMAHFLLSAAAHRDGLEGALLLTDTHLPLHETERLDQTLTLALKHLRLPPGWSVLSSDVNTHSRIDFSPQETLLHFAARRGLRRVALFLLQQPGGRDALQHANKHGYTPARLAHSRGHTQLQHLLSELENSPHLEAKAPRRCYPAGRALLHHPRLNTFTLTVENEADGDALDLRRDVEELRRYARSHHHSKAGSRKHLQSFPVILSRDLVAVTPPEDASPPNAPVCEHQEVETEPENVLRSDGTNGSARPEEGEISVEALASRSSSGDSVQRILGLECEGLCAGKPEHLASVSGVSCSPQRQQEEVDSELRVIREAPRTQGDSETKTRDKVQPGNTRAGAMGQTQGLLPEKEEKNKARGDLPEEREGERDSGKETGKTQMLHRQTSSQQRSQFYLDLDVNASEKAPEIPEAGNSVEVTGFTKPDQDLAGDSDSRSLAMAPGPVHDVHLEPSPDVHQPPDVTSGDQLEARKETSDQVISDSVKEEPSPPCQDLADAAPGPALGSVLDVPLVAEEHTQMDHQTLLPETVERSLPGLGSDIQQETPQMLTKEPSQEHDEPQSDITPSDSPIVDAMDQNGDLGSSHQSLFVLDQTFPSGLTVSDSIAEEPGDGFESEFEREPAAFQTPPESPCEYFSVDGFIRTNDSIEVTFPASGELPAGTGATTEKVEKVETKMRELCESSKKSPVTILCGSFSKLNIRGSPPDPHLDSTTSENIESKAVSVDDSETSTSCSSEMVETKEEVKKLEPELVEKCERSEPSQISAEGTPCKLENLEGTAIAGHDQPPESTDVQEELLKVSAHLGENPEIPSLLCEPLSPSISVCKNITELHSEVINKTSEDLLHEVVSSTETVVETSLLHHLEVNKFKENIVEELEVMTSEESVSETPDLPHEIIASSQETTVETSPDPLPEAKTSQESIQDQQPKISEDRGSETSLDLPHDLITSSVETNLEASHVPHLDISRHEERNQSQQLYKSRNDLHDLKHEVTTIQESVRGTSEFHHDLIATSEETIRETSCDQLPEVSRSEENVPDDGQAEHMTCEKSKNEDPTLQVTTSKNDLEDPNQELMICGETALDEQLEISSCEESIGEAHHHTQREEKTCEENLRTTLDPPPEFMSTKQKPCLPEGHTETPSPAAPVLGDDSGLDLENVPSSGLHQISDLEQPVDLNCGSGLDMEVGSPVEVDSGVFQDIPPLENVGVRESGALDEEKRQTKNEERVEEPKEEQVAGDEERPGVETTHTNQRDEIHREEEEEVLYSLGSKDLKQDCSKEKTQTDVAVASVCRSVSATSLPGSESVSEGDSLLGPDTTDDTVFKQSEDSLTLTSGISMTGSISTDDSSITHTAGETEEEEKKDRLMEVLERSSVLRTTSRSLSPSRRHSWGSSKNQSGETDMGQRSVVKVEVGEKSSGHRRSMSWCPSHLPRPEVDEMNSRSYSLEGLATDDEVKMPSIRPSTHSSMTEREERGSLASLTEEENESNLGDNGSLDSQRTVQDAGVFVPPYQPLTKSISMLAISPRNLDAIGRVRPKRRISFSFSVSPRLPKPKPLFAFGSSSSDEEEAGNVTVSSAAAGSQEFSISEEDPAPLRSDSEVKVTKVSRTFSYLKSKMSKKSKDKDREKNKDVKEKKSSNGHQLSSALTPPPSPCLQCNRPISTKDALTCTNCNIHIHKSCRDALPLCVKANIKQTVTDSAPPPGVLSRGKSASARDRPWSTFLLSEDQPFQAPLPPPRKNSSIMTFNSGSLSKSISISNIAGQLDEAPLKALKILSQSTDSLNKMGKVNESTESLADEGTELMDHHLMVEFEAEVKELEADSWSLTVDKKYLKQLKKDIIKRQDVIYELIQTEMHHVRTLRIMAEVYSKGLQKELQVDAETLDKMFPVLEDLMELHTHFLTHLLERRREARDEEAVSDGGFVIRRIGDVLLDQVTGSNAEKMKKVYGKFCTRHNEAVNVYKDLHMRDKRFQAFIKKKMSSAVVRRLSIPECILLVTQRITKYPVLLQRLLQHTRETEEEADVAEALRQVKEVLTGVDSKVNEYEKRRRLKEVHSRTDSKSIMRMKSGQMFAREDLIRGRKLLHDGLLQVKNSAGRLKDVQALLLSDVFVFLQEKDQKYVFASLDQRSTVISLQKLIVREVANEERGLFFITAGIEKPEMVEVHASSKDERNTWMQLIQNAAATSIDKEDDEGIPSENEEDKRLQESKAKEMKDQLQKKDEQIVTLLEEKVRLFRELCDCANQDEASLRNRMMFRATSDDVTKGEPIINDALKEVETLQELVNSSVAGQQVCVGQEDSSVCAGSVSLPRRAETFGGFDCHQMNISKNGEREEADDLRRTESDSVLKKGGTANLLLLHKRNSEQVLNSVTRLHDLLNTLQAVVVQQDTFIEEQRQALSSSSHRHPSVSSASSVSSLSSSSSRPSSLMEQEKQRQEEKVREEDRRRREEEDRKRKEEAEERRRREEELMLREERLRNMEDETQRRREELQQEQQELSNQKEEYQRELLRLRDDRRRLEREREQIHKQTEQQNTEDSVDQRQRTSSTASEDSLKFLSSTEAAESVEVFSRSDSKRKAKTLNPFSSTSAHKSSATESQPLKPTALLQLTKPRDKKEKKKKKGKGGQQSQATEPLGAATPKPSADKDVYFC